MDLAIKFGNIDALLSKAEEFMQHGDMQNGTQAVLQASRDLKSIELSENGSRFIEEIKKRQERGAAVIFNCKGPSAEETKQPKGAESNNVFNLDKVLIPADKTIFLEDMIGLEQVKVTLLQAILLPAAMPDFMNSAQRWRGILLFGTSGVGKSKILSALNNSINKTTEVQITFINLTLDVVLGAFHGDTEKTMTSIFKAAALRMPIVILFDEIDSLCSARTDEKQNSETKIINHFLSLMDSISSKTDLVVVGTTNKVDSMDFAFYRRFQKMLYVELPDLMQREQLLTSLVGRFQSTSLMNFRSLAAATERFSSADLTNMIACAFITVRGERVAKKALELMEASKRVNVKDLVCESDYRPINEDDLWKSFATMGPTNKHEDIRRLDKFANTYCGRQETYSRIKSDLSLPTPKMFMKKPMRSLLKTATCLHEFFGNGI